MGMAQLVKPENLQPHRLDWPGGLGQLCSIPTGSGFRLSAQEVGLLSAAERNRLLKNIRPEKTQRSLAARAKLRKMLGQILCLSPEQVAFVTDAEGRPGLDPRYNIGTDQLDFSVSYGPQGYCVGIARGRAIGVDLQRFSHKQKQSFDHLFGNNFARRNQTRLEPQQIWTRMEAYGKMQGQGLGYGMHALYKIAIDARTAPIPCHFLDYRLGAGTSLSVCISGPPAGPLCVMN